MAKLTKLVNSAGKQDILTGADSLKLNNLILNKLSIGKTDVNIVTSSNVHSDQDSLTGGYWHIVQGTNYIGEKINVNATDNYGNKIVAISGQETDNANFTYFHLANGKSITYRSIYPYVELPDNQTNSLSTYYIIFDVEPNNSNVLNAIKSLMVKYEFDYAYINDVSAGNIYTHNLHAKAGIFLSDNSRTNDTIHKVIGYDKTNAGFNIYACGGSNNPILSTSTLAANSFVSYKNIDGKEFLKVTSDNIKLYTPSTSENVITVDNTKLELTHSGQVNVGQVKFGSSSYVLNENTPVVLAYDNLDGTPAHFAITTDGNTYVHGNKLFGINSNGEINIPEPNATVLPQIKFFNNGNFTYKSQPSDEDTNKLEYINGKLYVYNESNDNTQISPIGITITSAETTPYIRLNTSNVATEDWVTNKILRDCVSLENGKIPASMLPGFVDDVLEYTSSSNFPSIGESGKIYLDSTTNKSYRWSGSRYVEISSTVTLGETSSTAYPGNKGKANADAISNIINGTTRLDYNNLINTPKIPTSVSELENNLNFVTETSLKYKHNAIIDVNSVDMVGAGTVFSNDGFGQSSIYFNTSLPIKDVVDICSNITFDASNIFGYGEQAYFVCNKYITYTTDNLSTIAIVKLGSVYGIFLVNEQQFIFISEPAPFLGIDWCGWSLEIFNNNGKMTLEGTDLINKILINGEEYNVGFQNDKLGKLISSTPFSNDSVLYRVLDWQGTQIPNSGYIDKLYLNTKLSDNEISNIISQLDGDDWGSYSAFTTENGTEPFVLAAGMLICSAESLESEDLSEVYWINPLMSMTGMEIPFSGWNPDFDGIIPINDNIIGNPQNILLRNLLSVTPTFNEPTPEIYHIKDNEPYKLADEQFVKDEISKIQLGGNIEGPSINLNDYALRTELFSKSYNDLTDKPNIPVRITDLEGSNNLVTLTDGKIPAVMLPGFVDEIYKINTPTIYSVNDYTNTYSLNNYYVIYNEIDGGKYLHLAKYNGSEFVIKDVDITDTILIDVNTNIQYRAIHESGTGHETDWSTSWDSHFASIGGGSGGAGLALGETSSTAYAGDKGKANADAIAELQNTVSSHTTKFNNYLLTTGGTLTGNINIGSYAIRSGSSSTYNIISQSGTSTLVGRTSSSYYTLLQNGTNVRSKMKVNGSNKDLAVLDDLTLDITLTNSIIDNVYHNGGTVSSVQLFNTLENLVTSIKDQHYTKQEIDAMGGTGSSNTRAVESNKFIKDVALLPNGNESVDFNPMNAPVSSTSCVLRVMPNCDYKTINSIIKSVCSYIPSETYNYLYENGYYEIAGYCYVILANENSYVMARYMPSMPMGGCGDGYQIAVYQKYTHGVPNVIYEYNDLNGIMINMQYPTSEIYTITNILNTVNVGDKNDIFGKIFTHSHFITINDMPEHYQIYKTNPVQPVVVNNKHKVTSLTFNTNLEFSDAIRLFDQLTFTEIGYGNGINNYKIHLIYDDGENIIYVAKYYSTVVGRNMYELLYEKKVQYYYDSSMSTIYNENRLLPLFVCEYDDDRTTMNGSWNREMISDVLRMAETRNDIMYGLPSVSHVFGKNIVSFKNGYLTFDMNGGVSKTSTEFIQDSTIAASSVNVGTQNTLLQNIVHEGVVGQSGGYFMMVDNEWQEVNLFGSSNSSNGNNSGSNGSSTNEDPITASYYGYDTVDDSILEDYYGEDDE